jgi:hypothetical protein
MTHEGRVLSGASAAAGSRAGTSLIEARDVVRSFGQTPALRGPAYRWPRGRSWP